MNLKYIFTERFMFWIQLVTILFGIFMVFQVLRYVFGGSWAVEGLILGMLFFCVTGIFVISSVLIELKSDFKHHKSQFMSLARDFKRTEKNVERILMKLE